MSSLNIDCSHWTGQGWNNGQKLKDWDKYTTTASFKKHLIKEIGNICENCNLSKLLDIDIPLDLHHIDGNRTNNLLSNLQLLCPNCHALTDSFKGKNIKLLNIIKKERELLLNSSDLPIKKEHIIKQFKERIVKEKPLKSEYIPKTKIAWPTDVELIEMIKINSISSIAKNLGVCDNAIRGRMKHRKIYIKSLSPWSQKHGSKPNTIIPS